MTVARNDPPGATLPLVTSQLNSDPNRGTPLDSRETEKDAVTWRRKGKKMDEREGHRDCTFRICVSLCATHRRGVEDVKVFLQALADSHRAKVQQWITLFFFNLGTWISQLQTGVLG